MLPVFRSRTVSPSQIPLLSASRSSPSSRRVRKKLQLAVYSLNGKTTWKRLIIGCFTFALLFILSVAISTPPSPPLIKARTLSSGTVLESARLPKSIVSKRGPYGRDQYPHTEPYTGNAYHITTSIGPAKELYKTHYILTSLWFFEDDVPFPPGPAVQQRLTPHAEHLHFECDYGNGREAIAGVGEKQARQEFYHVECDVPSWLAEGLDRAADEDARQLALRDMRLVDIQLNAWVDLGPFNVTKDGMPVIQTRQNPDGEGYQALVASHRVNQWEEPELESEVAICVTPLRFDASMTMTDVLEWRLFHAYQGVDRVHWYSRTPEFGAWVDQANALLGLNDSYLETPNLSPSTPSSFHYADQAVWLQDCMLRYGFFDEWQAMIDIDEYLFPVDQPAKNGVRDRLRTIADDVGTVLVFQTYVGGERLADVPAVDGFERFPRNAFSHWEPNFIRGGARFTKAIHRPIGIRQLWVHNAIWRGWWFKEWQEDAQTDAKGVLNLVHSRKEDYPGLRYTEENKVNTSSWRAQWEDLAEGLRGLEVLHSIPNLL